MYYIDVTRGRENNHFIEDTQRGKRVSEPQKIGLPFCRPLEYYYWCEDRALKISPHFWLLATGFQKLWQYKIYFYVPQTKLVEQPDPSSYFYFWTWKSPWDTKTKGTADRHLPLKILIWCLCCFKIIAITQNSRFKILCTWIKLIDGSSNLSTKVTPIKIIVHRIQRYSCMHKLIKRGDSSAPDDYAIECHR